MTGGLRTILESESLVKPFRISECGCDSMGVVREARDDAFMITVATDEIQGFGRPTVP